MVIVVVVVVADVVVVAVVVVVVAVVVVVVVAVVVAAAAAAATTTTTTTTRSSGLRNTILKIEEIIDRHVCIQCCCIHVQWSLFGWLFRRLLFRWWLLFCVTHGF